MSDRRIVGKSIRKKDAMRLLLGKPAFVEDVTRPDALVVKVLRSPHANAVIREISTQRAMTVPGIEAIYTYQDVPQKRFTMAGQTYPEPSPYDRLLLDRHVRFVGDAVAIIAGETEQAVDRAMKLIRVDYEVLEPVLDFHQAKDNPILVHPEDSWRSLCPVGADNRRNLCASGRIDGEIESVLQRCDQIISHTYHVKACQQAMMETFRTYTNWMPTGGSMWSAPPRSCFIAGGSSPMRWISPNPWFMWKSLGSAAVSVQSRRWWRRYTQPSSHGKQASLPG